MLMYRKLCVVLLITTFLPIVIYAEEKRDFVKERYEEIIADRNDAMPAHLQIISWVEVIFKGELLKKYKTHFEKFMRERLRDELPVLMHEVKPPNKVHQEYNYNLDSEEVKKRGYVYCHIWTVGKDYPVAFLVELEMKGCGNYKNKLYDTMYYQKSLGYGSAQTAKRQVEESIRELMAEISTRFSEHREIFTKIE